MGIQDREYFRRWQRGDSKPPKRSSTPPTPPKPYRPRAAPDRTPSTPGYLVREQQLQRRRRIKLALLLGGLLTIAVGVWALINYGVWDDLRGLFDDNEIRETDSVGDPDAATEANESSSTAAATDGDSSPPNSTANTPSSSSNGAGSTPAAGDGAAAATESGENSSTTAGTDGDSSPPNGTAGTSSGSPNEAGSAPTNSKGTAVVAPSDSTPSAVPPVELPPPAECPDPTEVAASADSLIIDHPASGIDGEELSSLQYLVLDLTNNARRMYGLRPVRLGGNLAPQEHAEDMAEHCFLSHWGTNGMKPYMRYSLAGGVQANAENVSGSSFCPADPSRYHQKPLAEEAQEAFEGLMNSPGHRANILRPEHRLLHLGMAYRAPNFWLVQHFSGHYAAFTQLPEIENGHLRFDMSACNGAQISGGHLDVLVLYDPLPMPLMPGQLQRTACYSSGYAVAALRPPLEGRYYTSHDFTLSAGGCLDPYSLDPDLPVPQSYDEAALLKVPARSDQSEREELGVWITADQWQVAERRVRVSADLSQLLHITSEGTYTIMIRGSVDGESVPIAEYSIILD